MKAGFMSYHPLTQLIFFASVLSFTMFFMHPVILLISLLAGSMYVFYVGGIKGYFNTFRLTFITSVMIVLINPLISHGGVTVLGYLPDGNPLTFESFIFGAAAALLMSCTLKWFYSVNKIFTSDRVIYLFGRITPKLALLISMTLSFVSKFISQLKTVRAAQYTLGHDISSGSLIRRIKNGIRILSAMIQWSLENSVDTADSMKSRGYGLKKRTSYSIYRIMRHDVIFILLVLLADLHMMIGIQNETLYYSYYPMIEIDISGIYSLSLFAVFLLLCLMPLIADIKENQKWKSIQSKI
ncbi:MAG: energy-coupling factor transporter transmembrane protein EcfT [Clostridia bacterium]|nr:energy-coupling factor transporter transmembrane protein EcfT [Clostridia bacterium]